MKKREVQCSVVTMELFLGGGAAENMWTLSTHSTITFVMFCETVKIGRETREKTRFLHVLHHCKQIKFHTSQHQKHQEF